MMMTYFFPNFVNIGKISGGVAHNVIANSATATVSIRAAKPTSELLAQIHDLPSKEYNIEILVQSEPQKLFHIPGYGKVILPFCTDIPYLKNWGRPLLIGPGNAKFAHTKNEKIEKEQLIAAVNIYVNLVKDLLEYQTPTPDYTK